MPGFNRTGPQGYGPMTGKGAGYCTGFARQGFGMRPRHFFGRGNRGAQPGMGRGMLGEHLPYYATPAEPVDIPGNELDALKAQAKAMTSQLDAIRQRIDELEQ